VLEGQGHSFLKDFPIRKRRSILPLGERVPQRDEADLVGWLDDGGNCGMMRHWMERTSQPEAVNTAIADSSTWRAWRPLLFCLSWAIAFMSVVTVSAQTTDADRSRETSTAKPWYDARLRAFFAAKEAQARELAAMDTKPVAPEAWLYFDAGKRGDWQAVTNRWSALRKRVHPEDGSKPDSTLDKVWSPILETDLAREQFSDWKEKYVLAYGRDIIKSIPPGSIYFGGTDAGRGVVTAMSESHAKGKPFYTITQNQLADGNYLDYVRVMYGKALHIPTGEDAASCFNDYYSDAKARFEHDERYPNEPKQIRPGEEVTHDSVKGTISIGGNTAVMSVNGLIVKIIFDHNPTKEFFVEESFPLDWMYPYLSPNGLIMKVNHQPQTELTEDMIKQDRAYWSYYLQPILGDWLKDDTSVKEIAAFAEKVCLKHDFRGFKGDPEFIKDSMAQKAFGKLRASIAASVYDWRYRDAKAPAERERMLKEADFAYRQAVALCPYSPEAVFHYVKLLADAGRFDDALTVSESCLKLDPGNDVVANLVKQLGAYKKQVATNSLEQLEKAVHDDLTDAKSVLNLIGFYLQSQQPGKVMALADRLEKVVHDNPANTQLTFSLFFAYSRTQQSGKAMAVADQLLADPKLDEATLSYLAGFFAQESNYRKLETTLELLIKRSPNSPETWYDLAGVKMTMGKTDEVAPNLKRALEENTKRLAKDPKAIDIAEKVRKDTRFADLLKTPEFQTLLPPK
jgi:tetratricopeptide (TPR) repeat protein